MIEIITKEVRGVTFDYKDALLISKVLGGLKETIEDSLCLTREEALECYLIYDKLIDAGVEA